MKMNKKLIVATAACAALLVGSISTSLAWLVDKTDDVTNTFTSSDINITLTETKPQNNEIEMVPGWTFEKNPMVTVAVDSEDCYVFVEITEVAPSANTFNAYLEYAVNDTWTKLTGVSGVDNVYYAIMSSTYTGNDAKKISAGTAYSVLAGDSVTVKQTVTKEMMNAIDGIGADGEPTDTEFGPKLTFKAYASQYWKNNTTPFTAAQAWANIDAPTQTYTNP